MELNKIKRKVKCNTVRIVLEEVESSFELFLCVIV